MKLLLTLLICFGAGLAMASDKGNGGDDLGLEFQADMLRVLDTLKQADQELYREVAQANLPKLLKKARVIVVDTPLVVVFNGVSQESVAVNDPTENMIRVNRQRWANLTTSTMREAIALHELLSLVKKETTGYYPISARYAATVGLNANELASVILLPLPTSMDRFAKLKILVSEAYLQNPSSQTLKVEKCRATNDCLSLDQDINGAPIHFNADLVFRPGVYRVSLTSYWLPSHPVMVQLADGMSYSLPMTHVYFGDYQGINTAEISYDLDDPAQLDQALLAQWDKMLTSFASVKTETVHLRPTDWSKDLGKELDLQNPETFGFNLCKALVNSTLLTREAALCRSALAQMKMTPQMRNELFRPTKASSSEVAVLGRTVATIIWDRVNGVDQNAKRSLMSYLKAHPETYAEVCGASDEEPNTGWEYCVLKPAIARVRATVWSAREGQMFLLTPGRYRVHFQNESGDSSDSVLDINSTQATVNLHP